MPTIVTAVPFEKVLPVKRARGPLIDIQKRPGATRPRQAGQYGLYKRVATRTVRAVTAARQTRHAQDLRIRAERLTPCVASSRSPISSAPALRRFKSVTGMTSVRAPPQGSRRGARRTGGLAGCYKGHRYPSLRFPSHNWIVSEQIPSIPPELVALVFIATIRFQGLCWAGRLSHFEVDVSMDKGRRSVAEIDPCGASEWCEGRC